MLKAIVAASFLIGSFAVADTVEEKVHDTKRAGQRTVHDIQDKNCKKGDLKCAEQKAGHKIDEGKEYMKDKKNENTK